MGLLTAIWQRRSLENPSTPLSDPDDWLLDALGAGPATTGVRVNRKSALTYSAFWRGVNLIAASVAKLPLFVYAREGPGKRRAPEHPAYYLLRKKPNRFATAARFRETLQGHALTAGNGYAAIFRAGDGTPIELAVLNPDVTYPVRETGTGIVIYVTQVAGQPIKLAASDVLHIAGLGFDGLTGYSVLQYARNSLGLGMAAEQYGARFFRSSARPSVLLEHPGSLTDEAQRRLRENWDRMHAGVENAHRTAVLEEGMKANVVSFSAKDAQFLETRQFEIRSVANWLGLPAHKLGDTTRTSFASLEQENQSYLDDSLDPWLVKWEEECWDKLLSEDEKINDTHIVEFLRAALVRADLTARANFFRTALAGAPWMTRDEVRGAENLNPLPAGQGAELLDPLNMVADLEPDPGPAPGPASQPDEQDDEPEQEDEERSLDRLRRDAERRIVRRLWHQAQRAGKQAERFRLWSERLVERNLRYCQAALAPFGLAGAAQPGLERVARELVGAAPEIASLTAYFHALEERAGGVDGTALFV